MTTATFIERSQPRERDDELPLSATTAPTAPENLIPAGAQLQMEAIERALESAAVALADMKRTGAQGDWVLLESAARRLSEAFKPDPRPLSITLAATVSAARRSGKSPTTAKE